LVNTNFLKALILFSFETLLSPQQKFQLRYKNRRW